MDWNSIKQNRRPIIYGVLVATALVFLQTVYMTNNDYFLVGAVIAYTIMVICIYLMQQRSAAKLNQFGLPVVNRYSRGQKLIQHLLIPSIGFWSFTAFLYSNIRADLSLILFSFSTIIFTTLFINIRAYHLDKFRLEADTHFIYDVLKIVSFFNLTDAVVNTSTRYGYNFFVVSGLVFIVAALLTLVIILTKSKTSIFHILLILLAALALGYLTGSLMAFLSVNNLIISFFSTLIFYMLNALIHHEINRTLRISTLLEYLLVAIICFLVILLYV